jgi:hypothetical protein
MCSARSIERIKKPERYVRETCNLGRLRVNIRNGTGHIPAARRIVLQFEPVMVIVPIAWGRRRQVSHGRLYLAAVLVAQPCAIEKPLDRRRQILLLRMEAHNG